MNIKKAFKDWPTPYIKRKDFCELTGFNVKTLRNLDNQGKGIPGKFFLGSRTVAYPFDKSIKWIEDRIKSSTEIVDACPRDEHTKRIIKKGD